MTAEEKFVFDLQGFVLLRNVLGPEELAALNGIADAELSQGPWPEGERTVPSVVRWGPPSLALIDHPRVLPYLATVIGPRFRLDHDYGIFMRSGDTRGPLHGGEGRMADWWYRCQDGVIRNGLCALIYFLTPAGEGDGGFACIPGSHKTHFLSAIPAPVREFREAREYLRQPPVAAGDAVLFTEALVHGTMPWRGAHERRILVLKYSPGHSASSGRYYDPAAFPGATAQQRRILSPPFTLDRPEVIARAVAPEDA